MFTCSKVRGTALTILSATLISAAIVPNLANANFPHKHAGQQLQDNVKKFEQLLNVQDNPETLLEFLDTTVSNDVTIQMTIKNDAESQPPAEVTLTKADYINSYLYGPRQVDNYQAKVSAQIVHIDQDAEVLVSKETLIETGTMKPPLNAKEAPMDFTTLTLCENQYSIAPTQDVVLESSKCKVNIKIEEDA